MEGNQPVKVKTGKGVFRCHLDKLNRRQTADLVSCSVESNADPPQEFLPDWQLEEPVQNAAEAVPARHRQSTTEVSLISESFERQGKVMCKRWGDVLTVIA